MQMQVVEELHLARSKKSLEVNLTDSYGELTCMDTDLPEDGAAIVNCTFFKATQIQTEFSYIKCSLAFNCLPTI